MAWAKNAELKATIDSVLTKVADLTNITAPSISRDEVDVSTHDSPDNYREYIGGMIDGGTVDIEGIYKGDSTTTALKDLLEADDPVAFEITTASGKTITFDGFVVAFDMELPFEDAEAFSASIKVTGKVTIA